MDKRILILIGISSIVIIAGIAGVNSLLMSQRSSDNDFYDNYDYTNDYDYNQQNIEHAPSNSSREEEVSDQRPANDVGAEEISQSHNEEQPRKENVSRAAVTTGKICHKGESSIIIGINQCIELYMGDVNFSIREETVIINEHGTSLLFSDLQLGDTVSVQDSGYWLESYPAITDAVKIILRENVRPTGEIRCTDATESTINILYSIENGKKTSIVREEDVIETWYEPHKEGVITDKGLNRDTLYKYSLINEDQELFYDVLDTARCKTKYQDAAKTSDDCMADVKEIKEEISRQIFFEYYDVFEEYYLECNDLLVRTEISSVHNFLKNRGWKDVSEKEWHEWSDDKKITIQYGESSNLGM